MLFIKLYVRVDRTERTTPVSNLEYTTAAITTKCSATAASLPCM